MKYVKCFIGENVRKGYSNTKIYNWRITHDKIYEVMIFSDNKSNVFSIKCDDNSIGSFTIGSESCGPADFTFMDATAEVRDNIINDILNYD